MRTEIKELYTKTEDFADQEVKVCGWIRTIRSTSNVGFIELNDGSFFRNLQVVFTPELEDFSKIEKYSIASSICVKGKVLMTENSKQPFELVAKEITLLGEADKDYPLQKKRHSFEFLRTIPHLRGRTNTFLAVFRVRSILSHGIHEFFKKEGFVYIHTPIITSIDAEGAGEVFQVTTLNMKDVPMKEGAVDYHDDFFGKRSFLTVSGQLAVEPFAETFSKVYTFGPTFRSENSNTTRHASEFWMIEPEIAFCDLEENMVWMERMIKFITSYVLEHAPEEMKFFDERLEKGLLDKLEKLLSSDFVKITYTQAIELLQNSQVKFEYPPQWGKEIQTEHEKWLATHFGGPVFVTDYPKDIKAFYMKQNEDGKTVRACDLLVPGLGEIIGGSQREDGYEKLLEEMKRRNMQVQDYQWYLDMRRFGSTPHSGFGLGFDRMLQYICGVSNIRDVLVYPRTPKNALM